MCMIHAYLTFTSEYRNLNSSITNSFFFSQLSCIGRATFQVPVQWLLFRFPQLAVYPDEEEATHDSRRAYLCVGLQQTYFFIGLYYSLIIPYEPWILLFCASNSDCSSGRIHMYINVEFWLRWTLIKWWENVISVLLLLLLTLSDSSNFRKIHMFSIVHHAPEADALKSY